MLICAFFLSKYLNFTCENLLQVEVVISLLPASCHASIARVCIEVVFLHAPDYKSLGLYLGITQLLLQYSNEHHQLA
jgi:hypothetical protein